MTKNPKIGALIPARLSSERLPGKHLKASAGKPMIHHLIDRLAACRHIQDTGDIVVCTTEDPSDDPLVPVVEEYGASVFRGSRDDIILLLSTSGQSPNVLEACRVAKSLGMPTWALTGRKPNPLVDRAARVIAIESTSSGVIQNAHQVLIHLMCNALEAAIGE